MTDSTCRLTAIAMAATLMLAACGGAAATTSPASAAASASTAPSATSASASTPAPTASLPSRAPGIDLSTLAGNWVGSIENVRLNDARGDFAGGTISVAGDRIELTYAGGRSFIHGVVGPTSIRNCRPDVCAVGNLPPWVMVASGTGTVAVHGPFTPENTCGAPAVPDAGVVTITPDRNKISFVTGEVRFSGGTCAAGSWHVVWTQVLTRAP